MTNTQKLEFIIIDDDNFNNTICQLVLKKTFGAVEITTFTKPEDALAYFANTYPQKNAVNKTIVLLDINMPTMSGWEFLNEFDKLSDAVKNKLTIYILSSSVDDRDISKAGDNKHVKDYFTKPIKQEYLKKIAGK
jgi:response regulator RpfG family c-di-GMP phosphodiesterase